MSPEAEKTRREFLEEALRQDPHNTFARYGLALELAKSEPAAAWTHFEYLLQHHPEYSATYFQAGAFLIKQGRMDEARKVLATGMEVTGRQGKHTPRQSFKLPWMTSTTNERAQPGPPCAPFRA